MASQPSRRARMKCLHVIATLLVLAMLPVASAFSPMIGLPGIANGKSSSKLLANPAAFQSGWCLPFHTCKAGRVRAVASPTAPRCRRVVLRALAGEADDAGLYSDALVDFKGAPCLVTSVSEKAEILQLNRKTRKAKLNDLQIVFPGPVRSWELHDLENDLPNPVESLDKVHAELLSEGGALTVPQLAEKLFRTEPTHLTAWAAWRFVQQGLYFTGTTNEIVPHPADKVAKDLEKIRTRQAQKKDQTDFIKRVKNKKLKPTDMDRMQDLEELAVQRTESSATLKLLGIQQTPQEAHRLLLDLGVWEPMTNPW